MNRIIPSSTAGRASRRRFLRQTGCLLAGAGAGWLTREAAAADGKDPVAPLLRIGLLTDAHYADKPTAGSRHYRDSLAKLAAAREQFALAKTDFVVELGDFIDSASSLEAEKGFLRRIQAEFAAIPGPRHCALGNHCVSALTKPDFLEIVGQAKSFYSFDVAQHHFVILDACFRSDGVPYGGNKFDWGDANVPPEEIDWLRSDLKQTSHPTIALVHQRLDVAPPYGVKNAAGNPLVVRGIPARAGGVSGPRPSRRRAPDQRHPLLHPASHDRGSRPGQQRLCDSGRLAGQRAGRYGFRQAAKLSLAAAVLTCVNFTGCAGA